MRSLPDTVIYSRDSAHCRRVSGLLHDVAQVHVSENVTSLELTLQQFSPSVVVVDLQAHEFGEVIALSNSSGLMPTPAVIALGNSRSAPWVAASQGGTFAVEDRDCPKHRLQNLVVNANRFKALEKELLP